MTEFHFAPPVGYTFRAEIYPADKILDVIELGLPVIISPFDRRVAIEERLKNLADALGIDYGDERSYDSNDFPKPVFEEQLTCSDSEWTELAPDHQWAPIALPIADQTCRWCGKDRS